MSLELVKDNSDFSDVGEDSKIAQWLESFPPDKPVIIIPVFNAFDDLLECLSSILQSIPKDIPLLITDDASTDSRVNKTMSSLSKMHNFFYVCHKKNVGFVGNVNFAFHASKRRDVAIVNSDVIVPTGWIERMKTAAYSRSNIATVTALTNNATILSVPYRNRPIPYLPEGMSTEQVDQRVRENSLQLYPIIPTAIGHCTYFKRAALDNIGVFDEVFAPGYGEEVDFSQRAIIAGYNHVLADDVFVYHKGSKSFSERGREEKQRIQNSHEQIINTRYPWYRSWIVQTELETTSPLAMALERARAGILGWKLAFDATYLDGSVTGTQVLALELIRAIALHKHSGLHLTVILGDHAQRKVMLGVEHLVDEVIHVRDLDRYAQPAFDLIHRPFQARSTGDLALLQRVSRRMIISHLDCIAYSNPSYALTSEIWQEYRSLTKLAFSTVDGMSFISNDALEDALHQGLRIPSNRVQVSYVGVDHFIHHSLPSKPKQLEHVQRTPFILVLGTNFKHKNRVFALQLFHELVKKQKWEGHLLLVGPSVAGGGSSPEEALERLKNNEIQSQVHYIGAVDEGEKQWLLTNAALVLYPSNYEGFGLVPFEAAAAGTPALTTRATALSEVLGDEVCYLDSFDLQEGVQRVSSLLTDPDASAKQVQAVQARSHLYSWDAVATRTIDFYRDILALPPRTEVSVPLPIVTPVTPTIPATHVLIQPGASYTAKQPQRETLIRGTIRRTRRAAYIWKSEGFSGFQRNVRGYLAWLISRN